jgi:hypothetical protein
MLFQLLDLETANAVAGFGTEAEALAEVRSVLRRHGPVAVATLALGYEDERGDGAMLASGAELIERALADEATGRRPRSA